MIQLPSTILRDLSWGQEDEWLFFSDNQIFAMDAFTGELLPPLTQLTGFGPDFSPVHNPIQAELYYLKTRQDLDTGIRGGVLSHIVTDDLPDFDIERPGAALYIDELEYNPDGAFLLAASQRGIWVQTQAMQTATQIVSDLGVPPQPTFSPDSTWIAYVDTDELGVPQIFVIDRRGGDSTQITFHQEGTITDLVWLVG
jgi:tricorn protease-like protein